MQTLQHYLLTLAKSTFVVIFSCVLFASCKKESSEPPFIMEGPWEGMIGTGSNPPSSNFFLRLEPDGTVNRIHNGSVIATGNWQLNGNNFTATYSFLNGGSVATLSATLDKAAKKLTGEWSNNTNETGYWYAFKPDN